jgi:hypothetical protein
LWFEFQTTVGGYQERRNKRAFSIRILMIFDCQVIQKLRKGREVKTQLTVGGCHRFIAKQNRILQITDRSSELQSTVAQFAILVFLLPKANVIKILIFLQKSSFYKTQKTCHDTGTFGR